MEALSVREVSQINRQINASQMNNSQTPRCDTLTLSNCNKNAMEKVNKLELPASATKTNLQSVFYGNFS